MQMFPIMQRNTQTHAAAAAALRYLHTTTFFSLFKVGLLQQTSVSMCKKQIHSFLDELPLVKSTITSLSAHSDVMNCNLNVK